MMRGSLGCACSLAIWLLVCTPLPAFATPSRVAVVRADADDRLLRDANTRLRAELMGAGFEVVEVDTAPGDARTEVETAARVGDSFSTVALSRASTGAFADVWISDHLSGKTVVRRVEVSGPGNVAAVLAIRALELLRASLLEVALPAPTQAPATSAPADVLDWVEPSLPTRAPEPHAFFSGTTLGVSALGLVGTGGLAPGFGPSLQLSHGVWKSLFLRVSLSGPLLGPDTTRSEGHASVRQGYASLELGAAKMYGALGVYGWLGAGVFHLRASGTAMAPYRATEDSLLSFLGQVGLGAVARVAPRLALSVELGVLLLTPSPVVVIAGQDAGTAGAPSVSLAVGVLIGL